MKFKFYRGFDMTFAEIGLVYFTCLNFERASKETQHKIKSLCEEIGREHSTALFTAVTTNRSLVSVGTEYNIDSGNLWRYCKRFYQSFTHP